MTGYLRRGDRGRAVRKAAAGFGRLILAIAVAGMSLVPLASPTYAAWGDLDTTFDGDGLVTTDLGASDWAFAVVAQPDGKLLAAGRSGLPGTLDFTLVRYHPDGSLDTTFGNGGVVTTDFGGGSDFAFGLVVQPDGKIVAAGRATVSGNSDFALARYHPDGSLDTSFGVGGLVTTAIGAGLDEARALALLPDGRLVVAGRYHDTAQGFAIARYNPDGTVDMSFGGTGKVQTDLGGVVSQQAYALVVQPDGKPVVAGVAGTSGSPDFALVRYTPAGTLDHSFGDGGMVLTDFVGESDMAMSLVAQPDGRLVAAGEAWVSGEGRIALARYNSDGGLDPAFGSGGKVTLGFAGGNAVATALVALPDGRLVAAGAAMSGGLADFALARFDSNGSPDGTFGSGGMVTTDLGEHDVAYALVLQPEGNLVAAGLSWDAMTFRDQDIVLARYFGSGPSQIGLDDAQVEAPVGGSVTMTVGVTQPVVAGLTLRWRVQGVTGDRSFSCLTDATGRCSVTIPGDLHAQGVDTVLVFADVNDDGGQDQGEMAASGDVTWLAPSQIGLDDAQVEAPVGGSVTMTVGVTQPVVAGLTLRWRVQGVTGDRSFSCLTDATGRCSVTIPGDLHAQGVDTVLVFADVNDDGGQDQGEMAASGDVTWLAPAYVLEGFGSPVDAAPLVNIAKAGRVIPLKFTATDDSGAPVTTLAGVVVKATGVTCDLGSTTDQLEEYAADGAGLQNLGGGAYQFNWAVPKGYAGSCKRLTLSLPTGSSSNVLTAEFAFRR